MKLSTVIGIFPPLLIFSFVYNTNIHGAIITSHVCHMISSVVQKEIPFFSCSGEYVHTSAENMHVIYYIKFNRFLQGPIKKVNKCLKDVIIDKARAEYPYSFSHLRQDQNEI